MKPWHWLALGVFLIVSAVGAYFWGFTPQRKSAQPGVEQEIPVRLVQARRLSLPLRIKVIGELRPGAVFNVRSRLAGKVSELCCKVGDFVKAGAFLVNIQDDGLEQRIAEQDAGVNAAREEVQIRQSELTEAEKRVADLRELLRRELIARRDFEMAESVVATNRAQAELARARLAQREAVLAQLRAVRKLSRVVAPADGLISRIFVRPGASVREEAAVMTVIDIDKLKLAQQIPADTANALRNGMVARVSSPSVPGVVVEGRVVRSEPLSGVDGNGVVGLAFANPQRVFRPGMAAEASLDLDIQEDRLVIPRSAVVWENQSSSVLRIRDNRAARQELDLGRELGDEIEVLQGLAEGDSVIADSPKSVLSGTRVRVLTGKSSDEKKSGSDSF